MSTRTSRKSANPRAKAPEPIITRTKSAQQRRQLRNKDDKKTAKPIVTKPVVKSPKPKTVKRSQQSLLKPIKENKETDDVIVVEPVEYYPNTLKRDVATKKIMLKPKHNFKVIAATNKRKLAIPQKGVKATSTNLSPQTLPNAPISSRIAARRSAGDLCMEDMVRIMEEDRTLTDEDFMEILTCPSPVWWEDPPDGRFDSELIQRKSSKRPLTSPKAKDIKKRKITTNQVTASSKANSDDILTIELDNDSPAAEKVTENKQDKKFLKKKLKLENVLGNIKNINYLSQNQSKTRVSESEGDFSDLSFNEEEILKNLENIEIPFEEPPKDPLDIESEKALIMGGETSERKVTSKNDRGDLKPELKEELSVTSPVFDKDSIPNTSLSLSQFIEVEDVSSKDVDLNSDMKSDDIVISDSCSNSSMGNEFDLLEGDNSSDSGMGEKSLSDISLTDSDASNSNTLNNSDIVPVKKGNNASKASSENETIRQKSKNEAKPAENPKLSKLDIVRGKLQDVLRKCESNRLEKDSPYATPAVSVTAVKVPTDDIKENDSDDISSEDDENRLKGCDYCVEKIKVGIANFTCDNCEMAPNLPCGLCNFDEDTKEVVNKPASSCKDIARISWSHNFVLNQT